MVAYATIQILLYPQRSKVLRWAPLRPSVMDAVSPSKFIVLGALESFSVNGYNIKEGPEFNSEAFRKRTSPCFTMFSCFSSSQLWPDSLASEELPGYRRTSVPRF